MVAETVTVVGINKVYYILNAVKRGWAFRMINLPIPAEMVEYFHPQFNAIINRRITTVL